MIDKPYSHEDDNIEGILYNLGITNKYKGYYPFIYMVYLAMEDESCLHSVMEKLYMESARHFNCRWTTIERNVRTLVLCAWQTDKSFLFEIAGCVLSEPPTVTMFTRIMARYVKKYCSPFTKTYIENLPLLQKSRGEK